MAGGGSTTSPSTVIVVVVVVVAVALVVAIVVVVVVVVEVAGCGRKPKTNGAKPKTTNDPKGSLAPNRNNTDAKPKTTKTPKVRQELPPGQGLHRRAFFGALPFFSFFGFASFFGLEPSVLSVLAFFWFRAVCFRFAPVSQQAQDETSTQPRLVCRVLFSRWSSLIMHLSGPWPRRAGALLPSRSLDVHESPAHFMVHLPVQQSCSAPSL